MISMVPLYIYDEKANTLLVDYYILCDHRVLINTELLVELLNQEFDLKIAASEFALAIYWNKSYECVGILKVSKGSDRTSEIKYNDVLRSGILLSAQHFSLVHNHPNRSLSFSPDDVKITKQFRILGMVLRMSLHEHILIAGDNYITFEGGD